MNPTPHAPWWDEAKEQLSVARSLANDHSSAAIFHALMALELVSKAVRLAPARIGDLHMPIGDLKGYTIGQLGGLDPKKGHDPGSMLDAPWHPEEALDVVLQVVADVERGLGLESHTLYEACRYPDRWPGDAVAPHTRLNADHAQRIIVAVSGFVERCGERLEA